MPLTQRTEMLAIFRGTNFGRHGLLLLFGPEPLALGVAFGIAAYPLALVAMDGAGEWDFGLPSFLAVGACYLHGLASFSCSRVSPLAWQYVAAAAA